MANAWAPSPSPSLDALSSPSSSSPAFIVGLQTLFALPRRLWDAYVAYLWFYQPNSWVGRVASTFRILAAVLILPVVLLTLLDVTSYVIARTLGVVDVKASTSDPDTTTDKGRVCVAVSVPASAPVPTDFMSEGPARSSEGLVPEDSVEGRRRGDGPGNGRGRAEGDGRGSATVERGAARAQAQTRGGDQMGMQSLTEPETDAEMETEAETKKRVRASEASPRAYYFTGEGALRLAGEGVFSPAVSMPPSPRMPVHAFTESDDGGSGLAYEEEGVALRRVQSAREDKTVQT